MWGGWWYWLWDGGAAVDLGPAVAIMGPATLTIGADAVATLTIAADSAVTLYAAS